MTTDNQAWIDAIRESVDSHRRMIDSLVSQLTDEELHARPSPDTNSVAIIIRHLGGNLRSRWTDFFTTDGEKPDRNRDTEFQDWDDNREALMAHLDRGWEAFTSTIDQLNDSNLGSTIHVRGEPHTVHQALVRATTHITYHVGQIAMAARMVHSGPWQWLTIAPGKSDEHNAQTWGTASSRAVFASTPPPGKTPESE